MSIKDVLGKLNTQAGKLSEVLSAEEIETLKSFDFDGHAKGIRVEAGRRNQAAGRDRGEAGRRGRKAYG